MLCTFTSLHRPIQRVYWESPVIWKGKNVSFSHLFNCKLFPHLCLLFLSGIDNGCTAHFCDLASLAIERPTTDLISNNVFDEEDSAIEPQ